jgi:hypothetical protein
MSGKFFRTVLAAVLVAVALVQAAPAQPTATGQSAPAPVAMEYGTTGT